MNQFHLPGCLFIEEGACERLNEILADCIPGIEGKRTVIVTEEALLPIMGVYLDEMKRDLPKSELYLIEENSFEEAMELAKYICMKDVEVVIGVGGGKVLDVAKYAGFVGKISYICVPTTLSNDSLSSPVAVLGTEGDARKTFQCAIPTGIVVDVNVPIYSRVSATPSASIRRCMTGSWMRPTGESGWTGFPICCRTWRFRLFVTMRRSR